MFGFRDGLLKISILKLNRFMIRNDPFSQDIIPTSVPPLLHEMPASDRQQLLEE
jgi:hypothetical protein